ncbi:MAG: putative porin [Saprospiraceae bacterium]|nr:putative porin [Saprospiraceae bacterium]
MFNIPKDPANKKMSKARGMWLLVFFFTTGLLAAQQPASPTSRPLTPAEESLLITFAPAPERSTASADTLPDADFRQYDPARRQLIDWGTLGNLGTAARPLLFETSPALGFQTGVRSFELYMLQPQQLGFYRSARTFSDVSFTQGRTQFETNLNARFARTFEGGTNFSLEYRTLNNLGQYRYQRAKNNALAAGLWVPVGKRYDGFFIFTQNVARQQDNGGIVSDDVFGEGDFTGPVAAEIRLPRQTAFSRLDDRRLQLTQHLYLTPKDIVGRRALRATHTFTWGQQKFKFSNQGGSDGLAADAPFFQPTFLTDYRGLRHFVRINRLDNEFALQTFKTKAAGRPSDLLGFGLAHSYYTVMQEPVTDYISNLFLKGNLQITPSDKFAFTAQGALGLLENSGEYQLQGSLSLGLGKAGRLSAQLLSQRRPPSLWFDQLYVSKRLVWDQDFDKLIENSLSATYALPLIGFEATARAQVINNYQYFDQNAVASQTTAPLQITQLILRENLRWGSLRFDNTLALQEANREDVFRLPRWFSKNSLYFSGKVFKKRMLLNAGVDFRINAEFIPDAYQPLLWQFHLQDSLTQKPYPWMDVFVSFKVQSFRGIIRYENLSTLWEKKEVFYQTAYHPGPFGALRFGIAWRFMDRNQPDAGSQDGSKAPPGIRPQ